MEPPNGFWATIWSFICFLPYFLGLLLLGIIKGCLLFPFICLIMTIGNSAIVLGLWPMHVTWTYYCIARAKQIGPIIKTVLAIGLPGALVLWPVLGILGSIIAGAGYGFLAPVIATFDAVGEGKTNEFMHCFTDGTWSTIEGSFTVVRDFKDVCFHSYLSIMDDFRHQNPPNGTPYEIRIGYIPGALVAGITGIMVDMPMITLIALYKSPYMLFKGWNRLFHDLIGREGPFLETACVPLAGLAIILWPLAVAGAFVASVISSVPLGAYAAFIAYQETSLQMGLAYIITSLSMFDEYSNDMIDMPEGSCFPRYRYRKTGQSSRASSFSRPASFNRETQDVKRPPSRTTSFKDVILDLKPIKLLEHLFAECKRHAEALLAEGVITIEDIQESRSNSTGSRILDVGLPAYSILQALLRSAKSNSDGLLLSDNTEMTSRNRPKDAVFDWFFEPLMIIKEQMKTENFSEEEEDYMSKLVLLHGDTKRLKLLNAGLPSTGERRKAEIEAFARRLQGITKSISRYPTVRRRYEDLVKSLSEELESKIGGNQSMNGSRSIRRARSGIIRFLSQKSFGVGRNTEVNGEEGQITNNGVV